jgi:hypothetical protein
MNALEYLRKELQNLSWDVFYGDVIGPNLWLLISALRGPDIDDKAIAYALKCRTTWRLRNAIDPDYFYFLAFSYTSTAQPDKPHINESIELFSNRICNDIIKEFPEYKIPAHFLKHYIEACWVYWKCVEEGSNKTNAS